MINKKEVNFLVLIFSIILMSSFVFSFSLPLTLVVSPTLHLNLDNNQLPKGVSNNGALINYSGLNNSAYFFNNTGYLVIQGESMNGFNQNNFSLETWIKIIGPSNNSYTNGSYIFSNNAAFILRQNNDNGLSYFICNESDSCWGEDSRTTQMLLKNKWYHIVIVHNYNNQTNLSNLRTYVNGKLTAEKNRNDKMRIMDNLIFVGQYFNGLIDEIKIYPVSLTNEEVNEAYNKYSGLFVVEYFSCLDSDDSNFTNKGYVNFTINNKSEKVYDSCFDSLTVFEKICNDNSLDTLVFSCPENSECKDGACITNETEIVIDVECTNGEDTCFEKKFSRCVGGKWSTPILAPGKCGYSVNEDPNIPPIEIDEINGKVLIISFIILILLIGGGLLIYFVFLRGKDTSLKSKETIIKTNNSAPIKPSNGSVFNAVMPNNSVLPNPIPMQRQMPPQQQPPRQMPPQQQPPRQMPPQQQPPRQMPPQQQKNNVLQRPYKKK